MAGGLESQHAGNEPHSILDSVFTEQIVGEAGPNLRTRSTIEGVRQHQLHAMVQCTARLQLLQVF